MKDAIGIGLIGCGVVGTGFCRVLKENAAVIKGRLGVPLEVRRIAVANLDIERDSVVPDVPMTRDAMSVATADDVDIVVEVMGGTGLAREAVLAAVAAGKHVVTANKALLAEHGREVWGAAEAQGVDLYYEAAVAGGIPVIRVLREALGSDTVQALRGIVNGTSNYILSRMQLEGLDFDVALAAAQEAGYAEADPTLDVGGGDAGHKLAILATLAFGQRVPAEAVSVEGIDTVSAVDMAFAARFGFVIKPLAIARRVTAEDGEDALDVRVHPALIRHDDTLASIHGALNAVAIEGNMVGPLMLSGPGAGAGPTATSVASDVIDIARNIIATASARIPARAFRASTLTEANIRPLGDHEGRYYLRLTVEDHAGVLAAITGALARHEVSIEQMFQSGGDGTGSESVTVVLLTHRARESELRSALQEISELEAVVVEPTRALRIED